MSSIALDKACKDYALYLEGDGEPDEKKRLKLVEAILDAAIPYGQELWIEEAEKLRGLDI